MKLNTTLTCKADYSLQVMMQKQVLCHGYMKIEIHHCEHNSNMYARLEPS
jgi:hypothetical protein